MILQDTAQRVETFGVEHVTSFKIKATAKAFKILSDGLYSDKITAIIRELSCNAYDAQVEAGTLDKPFQVHLPSPIEPWFAIRDFGTGMSPKTVKNVYTTYFESPKTDSNEVIGCLGLGSKSPFGYTDQFSVTSFYKGKKYIYNAFINENGTPDIAEMMVEDTTEPNGVEINFPVEGNHADFQRKSSTIYSRFSVTPEFVGSITSIQLFKPEYVVKTATFGQRKGDRVYGPFAIMGNICYPLSDFDTTGLTTEEKMVLGLPIDFFFNIGDLEFAASREKLSYNKETREAIIKRVRDVVEMIKVDIEKRLEACRSPWEARCLLHQLTKGDLRDYKNFVDNGKSITFKGAPLSNMYYNFEGTNALPFKLQTVVSEYRRRKGQVTECRETFQVKVHPDTLLFYRDTNQYTERLCKHFRDTYSNKNIIMLDTDDVAVVKDFAEKIGYTHAPIAPVSGLAMPPVEEIERNVNANNSVAVLKYSDENATHGDAGSFWVREKADKKSFNVYVVIDRYKIVGHERDHVNEVIDSRMELLTMIGVPVPTVYGVKEREADNPKIMANWVKLDVYVQKCVEDYLSKNPSLVDTILRTIAMSNADDRLHYDLRDCMNALVSHDAIGQYLHNDPAGILDSNFREIAIFHDGKDFGGVSANLRNRLTRYICNNPVYSGKVEAITNEIIISVTKVFKHYPLLKGIASNYKVDKDDVLDYMKTVDGYNSMMKMVVEG